MREIREIEAEIREIEAEITELTTKIAEFGEDHDFHTEYDALLDECHVELFGLAPSRILKEVDPIQYNCGYTDFVDSLQRDDFECCNEYQELKEKLEELQEELEELQEGAKYE